MTTTNNKRRAIDALNNSDETKEKKSRSLPPATVYARLIPGTFVFATKRVRFYGPEPLFVSAIDILSLYGKGGNKVSTALATLKLNDDAHKVMLCSMRHDKPHGQTMNALTYEGIKYMLATIDAMTVSTSIPPTVTTIYLYMHVYHHSLEGNYHGPMLMK